jgi:hypothetical protein
LAGTISHHRTHPSPIHTNLDCRVLRRSHWSDSSAPLGKFVTFTFLLPPTALCAQDTLTLASHVRGVCVWASFVRVRRWCVSICESHRTCSDWRGIHDGWNCVRCSTSTLNRQLRTRVRAATHTHTHERTNSTRALYLEFVSPATNALLSYSRSHATHTLRSSTRSLTPSVRTRFTITRTPTCATILWDAGEELSRSSVLAAGTSSCRAAV